MPRSQGYWCKKLEKSMNSILAAFVVVLGIVSALFTFIVFFTVYQAWIFSVLWGWFAVPIFALPTLSIPACIGVVATVRLLTQTRTRSAKNDKEKWQTISAGMLAPLIALLVAWVAKQFM